MRRNSILIFLFYFLSQFSIKGQLIEVIDYHKELGVKFNILEQKKLEKGVKLLNTATVLERHAITMVDELEEDERFKGTASEYKKAVKKLVEASENYREGHMLIYSVFQDASIREKAGMKKMAGSGSGINKAKYYEQKSSRSYNRALNNRDLLATLEKPEILQYKMAEAFELEKLAIRDRGRALQIFQDFPVEYNYGWADDVTAAELDSIFGEKAVVRPPDDFFVQKPTQKVDSALVDTNIAYTPIVFRVQIAAHTVQMSDEYIRDNIYRGKIPVREILEDNWYKYSIGEFDNFKDANALLKHSGVRKAFIVAYQGNVKLTIKDALAIIREHQ